MLKSFIKQDYVVPYTVHNIRLFKLDIKFPLTLELQTTIPIEN